MATILCVTSNLSGPFYSTVELARRLASAGHHVTCASSVEARHTVECQGLEFLALEPNRYPNFLADDNKKSLLERLRRRRWRCDRAMASLGVDHLPRTIDRLAPDLILIDGENHEQIIAASTTGRPLVLLNSFVSIWRRPGLPPPHRLAIPGVGWKGTRPGMEVLWLELRLRKMRTAWSHQIRRVGCDRLSLLRRLAAASGFDFRRKTDASQWLMPFTYRQLPVLSLHAREFEFPHQPPGRVSYVGPMLLEKRGDEAATRRARAELETLFARRRSGRRALIYAGFGSFFSTDLDFLRRLLEAVAAREDWDLVLSLGGRIEPEALGPLPKNVFAFGWVPQLEVLRHADVAVIHGGINTVDECVLSGVPMLVYCGFETDMAGNTCRVVYHQIGLSGDRRRDDPRAIREQIDRLLRQPCFADNIHRLRAHYAAYTENRVAERAVDKLLEAGRARS